MSTTLETPKFSLEAFLSQSGQTRKQKLAALATINLGIIEALAKNAMTPIDAIASFFNAENCIYVRRQLKSAAADDVMSRGVQLPDLFDILPVAKAKAEFAKELKAMRERCLKLLRE